MSARPRTLPGGDPGARAADKEQGLSPVAALLMLVVLLMPFPVVLVKFTHGNAAYDYQVILFPSDLPLGLLLLAMIPSIVARVRQRRLGVVATWWLLLLAWMVVAFAFHPSGRGAADLLRLAGTLAMIVAVVELATVAERGVVVLTVAAAAVFEAVVAFAQLIRGSAVGLSSLGEFKVPFQRFESAKAPQGTMVHPYLLAGLAGLVAVLLVVPAVQRRRPLPWLAVVAVAVAPIGVTFSRAAVLGLGAAVAVLLTGMLVHRGRYLAAVAALCLGAAVPAAIWNAGWLNRAGQSFRARGANQLATDRGWLMHEASILIGGHPVVGVGPGRYVIALQDRYHTEPKVGVFKPVHNLPMLLAAEGGLPAGIALSMVLVLSGWRALHSGRLAVALVLVYLPFTLLDHFPYSFPQGLVMTGLWLGAIEVLARNRAPAVEPEAA